MADAIEKALEEHVILLRVRKFVLVLDLEALHKMAELILIDFHLESVLEAIALHNALKTVVETHLSFLVILCLNGPLQQIDDEVGGLVNWEIVVRFEVEQERAEDVAVSDAIVEKRVNIRVL